MKNKINIVALIKLAQHLEDNEQSQEFRELQMEMQIGNKTDKYFECLPFSFKFMPFLFPEWEYWKSEGLTVYRPIPYLVIDDIQEAMKSFFNISEPVYNQLFVPGQQNTLKYGGKILHVNSEPKDVARNIMSYLSFLQENNPGAN